MAEKFSTSIEEVNIPEIKDFNIKFFYNFYEKTENIKNINTDEDGVPLNRVARYTTLSWKFSNQSSDYVKDFKISNEFEKIISEDSYYNPGYINYTFSDVSTIAQGLSDIENASLEEEGSSDSIFKMSRDLSRQSTSPTKTYFSDSLELFSSYHYESLGIIYDNVKSDIIRDTSKNISISTKISSTIKEDIFKNGNISNQPFSGYSENENFKSLPIRTIKSRKLINQSEIDKLYHPVNHVGYIVERYILNNNKLSFDKKWIIEDIKQNIFTDKTVLYGKKYLYAVKVVSNINLLTKTTQGNLKLSSLLVSSRPVTQTIETKEYIPPPEPDPVKFSFDYSKRKLTIMWDTPVNPQKDIGQFQVFRRKSIKEPFELIAQIGFDETEGEKHLTEEIIDANNVEEIKKNNPEYLDIIYQNRKKGEIYQFTDNDFYVDEDSVVSSDFIYAICSVDVHGMISNYSSQHRVTFDSLKNRLISTVICDSGCPKQYPNMRLRSDSFKDSLQINGDNSRKLKIYFNPEHLSIKRGNISNNIVSFSSKKQKGYYLLQLINLDNQNLQSVKISIKDEE